MNNLTNIGRRKIMRINGIFTPEFRIPLHITDLKSKYLGMTL